MAGQTQEIVGRYIISGRSLDKAAEEIEAAFEVEKFHAATLIRTEVAQARAVSDLQGYEDMRTCSWWGDSPMRRRYPV